MGMSMKYNNGNAQKTEIAMIPTNKKINQNRQNINEMKGYLAKKLYV